MSIRPGIGAVVRDQADRVLLHWRPVGRGWAPISGGVEAGEDVVTALHREVHEETGLKIRVERLVGVYSDPGLQIIEYPDGRTVHFVTCLFACRNAIGHLRGSEEGLAWAWFAPDELPSGLLPYAEVWLRDALAVDRDTVVR